MMHITSLSSAAELKIEFPLPLPRHPPQLFTTSQIAMSSSKKKHILNTVSVDLGCSSCSRPRLAALFGAKPRHSSHRRPHYSSSSSLDTTTTTTFSSAIDTPPVCYASDADLDIRSLRAVQGFGRLGGESVAVEKDSDDPYMDFRRSMLQMILEKEMYSRDDLKELLNCFLQLNSPYHHGIIVRAFTEIWNGVCSARPSAGSPDEDFQRLLGTRNGLLP